MIKKKIILFLYLFCVFSVYAEDSSTTAKPYDKDEFPQLLKDLRRFEIVTLGAIPFVSINTSLIYTGYKSYQMQNLLSKESLEYNYATTKTGILTQQDQINLLITSTCISVGIGLSDLIVQLIKRSNAKKETIRQRDSNINIIPIDEDPEAIKLELPKSLQKEE
ncbi:MAG: hypothetical protein GX677_07915 [Treponema sp.]|nr:hypothetical protein [Treponema sp.]